MESSVLKMSLIKNLWGFVLVSIIVLSAAICGLFWLISFLSEPAAALGFWADLFGVEGMIFFGVFVAFLFIGSILYPFFKKAVMEGFSWFTAASASALAVIAVVVYLLLMIMYALYDIPMEAYQNIIYLFAYFVPWIFILSIPYAIGIKWVLKRKGVIAGNRQFLIALAIGAVVVAFTLAVFFPCNREPFFVGGYLMKSWFGGK